ncbi:ABC-type nitrate/sulfonate/bicarbonate transport system substrate-binding protein [Bradyrhizobium sp. LB7.1]
MRSSKLFATIIALTASTPVLADDIKVGVGISGWTGFAPLTLAKGSRHLQEERPRRHHQEDSAEGPPSRDRLR